MLSLKLQWQQRLDALATTGSPGLVAPTQVLVPCHGAVTWRPGRRFASCAWESTNFESWRDGRLRREVGGAVTNGRAPFFFHPSTMFFSPSLFFPPSKPSFFTLKNHFFPTLWNLFFSPFENLFFSPCTLPFSPCSMFLSPFTLFFSPFTLSFSPSTLSFQPSAGEAGNPWNLRRERCHLRLVSRRVCAAAKPEPPSGNCAETIRNDANRRKLTRTPPGREALQQSVFHPPFFSTLETFFFDPQKSFFTHPVEPFFFSPFENLFFSPCTLPFSPCSMFLSPFTLFFSPFTLSFSPSTLSCQPSAGEAGNPWNLRRERCHLRLVSRRVCAAAKPVVVTSKTSWDQPFRTLRKLRRDYPERREPAETAPGREAAQHPSMHPSTNGVPTNRPTNEETTRPSKETKQATNEPSNQTT